MIRRTAVWRACAIICAVVAIAISGPTPLAAQDLTLRLATGVSQGGDVYLLLEKFKQEAETRSGGKIKVDFFFGGTLGNDRQLQEQLLLGTIEAVGLGSTMVELDPRFGIFDLPFLFNDRDHVYGLLDAELGGLLTDSLLQSRKARILAYGEIGFRQITNNVRPIMSPDDLKGLKMRTPSNRLRIAAFKALGAAPTAIPYKELYTALQQRVVDGQENPLIVIQEKSLWEVQKYISLTNHVFTPAYLVVNEDWWQGLSDDQRQTIGAAASAAATWQRNKLAGMDGELMAEARANGMQIDTPDLAPFAKLTGSVWETYESAHGRELIDLVMKAR